MIIYLMLLIFKIMDFKIKWRDIGEKGKQCKDCSWAKETDIFDKIKCFGFLEWDNRTCETFSEKKKE